MLRLQDWRSDLGASHSLEFYLTGEIAKNMLLCLHTFTFTMTGSCLPTQQTPLFQIRRGWPFASNCLEAVCLLNCGKMRQLLHLHTFPFTMTGDCLTNFLRIKKDWQLLCDQSKKTNQIFEERQIFLRSVRDFIRASEIKSRSLRFLAERQRFLRSVRDMYSRKKHASKKLSL